MCILEYKVVFSMMKQARFMDIWEQAVLIIKREGYSIKCSGPRGVVVVEKFEQATSVFFFLLFFCLCK
jgi:hypothetical protein